MEYKNNGKKWIREHYSDLYLILREKRYEVFNNYNINNNNKGIIYLSEKIGRSPDSILSKLTSLKFIKNAYEKSGKRVDLSYYIIKNKDEIIENIFNYDLLKNIPMDINDKLISDIEYDFNNDNIIDVESFISKTVDKFNKKNISSIEIINYLLNKNLITIDNKGNLITVKEKEETQLKIKEIHNIKVNDKKIPNESINKINKLRSEGNYIFDEYIYKNDNPTLLHLSDGTGSGKSYSVISTYIDDVKNSKNEYGFKNLIFMTPFKAQINLDSKLMKEANDLNINLISYISKKDMKDPNFQHWLLSDENTYKTNTSIFKKILSLKGDNSYDSIKNKNYPNNEFKNIIKEIVNIYESINDSKIKLDKNYNNEEKEYLIEKIKTSEYKLIKLFEKCIQSMLKHINEINISSSSIFDSCQNNNAHPTEKMYELFMDFYMPFERAKYQKCIIACTTKKFDYKTNHIRITKRKGKDYYTYQSIDLSCLIGQKLYSSNEEDDDIIVEDILHKTKNEKIEHIKNMMQTDFENAYYKNSIQFVIIFDEEHTGYKHLLDSRTANVLGNNIHIPHVFAALHRIINSYNFKDDSSRYFKTEKEFIENVEFALINKCKVKNKDILLKITSLFQQNLNSIFINSKDVEQILSITKNIFNVSPQSFSRDEDLKKIKIRGSGNNSGVELYFDEENNNEINLLDFLHVSLATIYAASKIKDQDYMRYLNSRDKQSQNSQLYEFIIASKKHKKIISSAFSRARTNDFEIDEYYTYFCSHLIFSLYKEKELDCSPSHDFHIPIEFKVSVVKELPEVVFLRMLYNTKNKVISLSATAGYHKSYSGCLSRDFINYYSKPFNYIVGSRNETDLLRYKNLLDARGEFREVIINEITNDNYVNKNENNFDFKDKFKKISSELAKTAIKNKIIIKSDNKEKEINRNLSGLLLAAYEDRHTLILSNSHSFLNLFRIYAKDNENVSNSDFEFIDKDSLYDIFYFFPFKDKAKIKVILYNSNLMEKINNDMESKMTIKNSELLEKICFISSFESAGTGLNNVITEGDFQEDFDRTIFTSAPYYSKIFNKEDGFQSIENYIILLKEKAHNEKTEIMKDLDTNLNSSENYKMLYLEHVLEKYKTMNQSAGRGERRDTIKSSELYFPKDAVLIFAEAFKATNFSENKVILNSMSLINHKIKIHVDELSKRFSFDTEKERINFSKQQYKYNNEIDQNFFTNFVVKEVIVRAKNGNEVCANFNDLLRHKDSFFDPESYMKKLCHHPIWNEDFFVNNNSFIKEIFHSYINNMYLKLLDFKKDLIFSCEMKSNIRILTDFDGGNGIEYKPTREIFQEINSSLLKGDEECNRLLREYSYRISDKCFKDYLPIPAMLPILKGNYGEMLTELAIRQLSNYSPINFKNLKKYFSSKAYEIFDFYIIKNNKLICIDAKMWSSKDIQNMSENLIVKAKDKTIIINELIVKNNIKLEPVFIYVNTRASYNNMNSIKEIQNNSIYFLNLFKINTTNTISSRTIKGKETYNYETSEMEETKRNITTYPIKDEYIINTKFIEFIQD